MKWATGVSIPCLLLLAACGSSAKSNPSPGGSSSSTASSAQASPSSSPSSSAPLSPFESDPAVVALRAWARQSALDFNNGQNYTDPALLALETSAEAPRTHLGYDEYIGTTFPGPLPLAPQAVRPLTPTAKQIDACSLDEGWAVDPTTKVAAKARVVDAVTFDMVLSNGKWLLDGASDVSTFSCATVEVPTQTW
jgi:hypothetical protein